MSCGVRTEKRARPQGDTTIDGGDAEASMPEGTGKRREGEEGRHIHVFKHLTAIGFAERAGEEEKGAQALSKKGMMTNGHGRGTGEHLCPQARFTYEQQSHHKMREREGARRKGRAAH